MLAAQGMEGMEGGGPVAAGRMAGASRIVPVAVALILGGSVVLAAGQLGVALSRDSGAYLGAAWSLLECGTLRVPIVAWDFAGCESILSHFPPGYPCTLAAAARLFGVVPADAVPIWNAVCLAVSALLLLWPLGRSPLRMMAATAFAVGPCVYLQHLAVLSEPLFLALMLAAFRVCQWSIRNPDRLFPVLVLSVLAAGATLTRYAGLFMIPAVVCLFAISDCRLTANVRRISALLVPYLALIGPWFWWLQVNASSARALTEAAPVAVLIWRQMLDRISGWILPDRIPLGIRNLCLLAGLAVAIGFLLYRLRGDRRRLSGVSIGVQSLIWLIFYLATIVLARKVADPILGFNARILAPAAVLLGLACADIPCAWEGLKTHRVWRWAYAVFAVWLLYHHAYLLKPHLRGTEFSREYVRQTGKPAAEVRRLLAYLPQRPERLTIYCNIPHAIMGERYLPVKSTPDRRESNRLREFKDRLQVTAPSMLVLFPDYKNQSLLSASEIIKELDRHEATSFGSIRVFAWGVAED